MYLSLAYTGARPAEIVDNEKRMPKDGSLEEVFGPNLVAGDGLDVEAQDDASQVLERMLCQEATDRGRPKALCYEDVFLMVVRHPDTGTDVLAMSMKFIHHKGADKKPKPYVSFTSDSSRPLHLH